MLNSSEIKFKPKARRKGKMPIKLVYEEQVQLQ